MEIEPKCKQAAIPKSKINSSGSFGSALDFLAMKNRGTDQKNSIDGKK